MDTDVMIRVARARALWTPEYLAALTLREGSGSGKDGDRCAVQEARYALGEDPGTDEITECMSPICHRMAISIQDARADWRLEIRAVLPALVGSRGSDVLETRRAYRLLDWSTREALPVCVDVLAAAAEPHDAALAAALRRHSASLRALLPIVDEASGRAAVEPLLARDRDRDLARARGIARDLARTRDLALALPLARALASARDLALALASALARARTRDLALARTRDLASARDLALALALARTRDLEIPSPVALLRELCEMREAT